MTLLLVGALLSLGAGLSLGLLGGGGSILTVPILVYVLGVDPHHAIPTSLVVVGMTSATGALWHARAGRLNWRVGLLFGGAGMLGAAAGGRVGKLLPPAVLLVVFSIMVVATALAMLRKRPTLAALPAQPQPQRLPAVLLNGFGVGMLTGLVGAGGGFMVVPALALFGGLSMPVAVATSLLVISLNCASGLLSASLSGAHVQWALAGGMSVASILGSLLGARLGRGIPPERLRKGFALFVLALGAFILVRELSAILPPVQAPLTALAFLRQVVLMHPYLASLAGGALLGLSASLLLLFNGRIAGISGITGGLLAPLAWSERTWRLTFLGGLVGGGLLLRALWPQALGAPTVPGAAWVVAAGLLVGVGSRLGNGCTSGHGVCGLSRGSLRSLVATVTFMVTAALTVFLVRHVLKVSP